jgi:hypothetical protein
MAKIRTILAPAIEGKHVTVSQARAALRKMKAEPLSRSPKKSASRQKPAAKAE